MCVCSKCSNLVYVSIGCVLNKFDVNSRAPDMISRDFRCTCIRFIMFGCSSRCIIHVCVGCMFICDVANIWMHIYIFLLNRIIRRVSESGRLPGSWRMVRLRRWSASMRSPLIGWHMMSTTASLIKKQEEPKQKRRRSTLRCSSGRSTTISNESTKNRGVSYSSAAEPTLASSSNGAPAEPMLADKGTQEVTKWVSPTTSGIPMTCFGTSKTCFEWNYSA